jgi:adenylyltransferase/sulfurtransferase
MPGRDTPCYRCLFPHPPSTGPPAGPFGVLPGIVGCVQAAEAVKLIVGLGEPLIGRLLIVDGLAMEFQEVKIRWDADCPVCGKEPTVTELIDYEAFCGLRSRDE